MKKHYLALIIAASLGLTACGGDSKTTGTPTVNPDIADSLKAETKVNFDIISNPTAPIIVMPTYLAMDQQDGTLSVESSAVDPTNLGDPLVAMGETDGWSTSQPIQINFTGNPLDPTTGSDSFHLIKSGDPTNLADTTQPTELVAGVDYQVMISGDTLTAILLKPLDPASNYMFAVTNDLLDSKGNPVGMSNSYAAIKATTPPPSSALLPAQAITHATENEFAQVGVDKSKIIFSSWFTTESIGDVLTATKTAMVQTVNLINKGIDPSIIWTGTANPNNKDLSHLYQTNITSNQDFEYSVDNNTQLNRVFPKTSPLIKAGYTQIQDAIGQNFKITVYKGTITLPYFLTTEVKAPNAPSNQLAPWQTTPWQSAIPSLAKIKYVMTHGSNDDKTAVQQSLPGINISDLLQGKPEELIKLMGAKVTLANGEQLDPKRLMTRYSPIPQLKDVVEVPFLLFVPSIDNMQEKPGMVIYQHGVTSIKETSYFIVASQMAQAITEGKTPPAYIAIDHPLHGERALKDGTVTTPDTPDVYMNLAHLSVARDNIRQSIIDDLGVRAAISLATSKDMPIFDKFDVTNISILGHSLGGITGLSTYRISQRLLGLDQTTNDSLFKFTAGAFANPGGGIAPLLLDSKRFGPTIKHSILLGSNNASYATECENSKIPGECFTHYFEGLDSESQNQINSTFSLFTYAAQTVLDTVDPYNMGPNIEGPVFLIEAKDDCTVPNQTTTYSIIGGTEPLATQMQLKAITDKTTGTIRGIARFNTDSYAQHSTVIAPQNKQLRDLPAHQEMQVMLGSFIANKGQGITVSNPKLISN
ncbi:VolA/Pla-1 family phospholipase [Photobacterium damselae]